MPKDFGLSCSAQRRALVSVVFQFAKAHGSARFSGFTLVGNSARREWPCCLEKLKNLKLSFANFMGPFELSFATVMGPPGCQ
jgi:hypothetical protein